MILKVYKISLGSGGQFSQPPLIKMEIIRRTATFQDLIKTKLLIKDIIKNNDLTFIEKIKLRLVFNRFNLFSKKFLLNKFFFLTHQNKLLGFGITRFNKVRGLFIRPDFQRKGYGRILLKCIEIDLKTRGYKYIFLKSTCNFQRFYFFNGYDSTRRFFFKRL